MFIELNKLAVWCVATMKHNARIAMDDDDVNDLLMVNVCQISKTIQ